MHGCCSQLSLNYKLRKASPAASFQPMNEGLYITDALRLRVFHKRSVTIKVLAGLIAITGSAVLIDVA